MLRYRFSGVCRGIGVRLSFGEMSFYVSDTTCLSDQKVR
jgi:hypothetical protein